MNMTEPQLTGRQQEILSVALDIVANEGTRALTMKRVAQVLNVTEPAIYRHFESKRHLLLSLYSFVQQILLSNLSSVLTEDCQAIQRLRLFVHKTLNYLQEHKGVNLILLAETIYHKDEQLRQAMLSIFSGFKTLAANIIKAGVKSGDFRADIIPEEYATCLAGMIQGALTWHMLTGKDHRLQTKETADTILDCFLKGILK